MINIFEEAFKANSQLSKKSLNESKVKKPKPDLSNNPKSITAILQKHKDELNKATSVKELYNLVSKWLKEEGVNTEASRRLLTNIASKKDITSAQFVVYNSILAGAGQEVIESKTGLKSESVEYDDVERQDSDFHHIIDEFCRKTKSTPTGYTLREHGWYYQNLILPTGEKCKFCYHCTNGDCDLVFKDGLEACDLNSGKYFSNVDDLISAISHKLHSKDKTGLKSESKVAKEAYRGKYKKTRLIREKTGSDIFDAAYGHLDDDEMFDLAQDIIDDDIDDLSDFSDFMGFSIDELEDAIFYREGDASDLIYNIEEYFKSIGQDEKIRRIVSELSNIDESKHIINKQSVREDVDSFQPDEDVLVVYNDELDDNMSDDEIEDVISNSINKCVCKCGICGANYIVNDDNFTAEDKSEVETTATEESVKKTSNKSKTLDESMLFKGLSLLEADDEDLDAEDSEDLIDNTDTTIKDDDLKDNDSTDDVEDVDEITSKEEENKCTCTCPICGATEQQSVIGKISEDDVITFDKDEESDDKTDEDDTEDKDDEDFDDTSIEDVTSEEIEEVDEPKVESKRRLRKRFKEAKDLDDVEDSEDIYAYSTREDPNPDPKFIISSNVDGEICRVSTKHDAEHTIETFKIEDRRDKIRKKQNIVYTCTKLDGTPCNFSINEKALNTLFTKFANENYENVKDVVFTNGKVLKDGNIKIEGIVNTKSGKVRSITLESVGFKISPNTKIIKFLEKGPFTESAKISSNKVPFVVECTIRNKYILVKSLKYNYRLSESNNTYAVYGKHSLFENRKMNSK